MEPAGDNAQMGGLAEMQGNSSSIQPVRLHLVRNYPSGIGSSVPASI